MLVTLWRWKSFVAQPGMRKTKPRKCLSVGKLIELLKCRGMGRSHLLPPIHGDTQMSAVCLLKSQALVRHCYGPCPAYPSVDFLKTPQMEKRETIQGVGSAARNTCSTVAWCPPHSLPKVRAKDNVLFFVFPASKALAVSSNKARLNHRWASCLNRHGQEAHLTPPQHCLEM